QSADGGIAQAELGLQQGIEDVQKISEAVMQRVSPAAHRQRLSRGAGCVGGDCHGTVTLLPSRHALKPEADLLLEVVLGESGVQNQRRLAVARIAHAAQPREARVAMMEDQYVALATMQHELVDLPDVDQADDVAAVGAVLTELLHMDVAA